MKVLLFCDSTLSDFDLKVLESLRDSSQVKIIAALINSQPKPGLFAKLKRELRKGRGGFVFVQFFKTLKQRFKSSPVLRSADFLANSFPGIGIKLTPALYKDEIIDWISGQGADVILLRGFGIIRDPLLSVCPFGVLSYHHGDMRKYRGGPPAFWELYNNEKEIGVSVQILDKGLDTGTLVIQKFFPVLRSDNWADLRKRIYDGSGDLALEALVKLTASGPVDDPVGESGVLYTLPNLTQWLTLQLKLLNRKIF